MRTIRRLYFYLIAFISLEVVLWSVITLARTVFDLATLNNIGDQIAGGLAFLIVGLPMFLFHWLFIQREAMKDTDERASRLREFFLYGTYLATLIPIAQNVIALINRVLLPIFELDNTFAFLGSQQTVQDNLIAIVVLSITFYYFQSVLKGEWAANIPGADLPGTRRLFRYIWMLYSLVLFVFAVVFILQFIFFSPTGFGNPTRENLANGLAILLVAAPLWVFNWQVIQKSLDDPEEYGSIFRLVVLYLLTLGGVIFSLTSAGWVIAVILRVLLDREAITIGDLFNRLSSTLALAIPMAVIWAYFGRAWNQTIDHVNDLLRKAALRRFYFYILALLGNLSVFFACQQLFGVLIDQMIGQSTGLASYSDSISNSLAMLIIGLPVWLRNWPAMQVEAALTNETGDHARRSIIRKSYLYLALFALVVGLMASAGMLLYNLISRVTVENPGNMLDDFLHDSKTMGIIIVWLVYHLLALRGDGKASQAALADQHKEFPVGIITFGEMVYVEAINDTLKRIAPNIPITELTMESLSSIDLTVFKALVIPASLLINNPAAANMDAFTGKRIIIPDLKEDWVIQETIRRSRFDSAKETARLIRLMAENQAIPATPVNSGITALAYILAGLFVVQILFSVIIMIISAFFNF